MSFQLLGSIPLTGEISNTSSPSRTRNDPNNLAHLSARINDIPRAPVSKRATCTRVISSASAKSSCRIFRLSRWLLRFKGTMNSSILSPPLCLQCNHQGGFCQEKVTQQSHLLRHVCWASYREK